MTEPTTAPTTDAENVREFDYGTDDYDQWADEHETERVSRTDIEEGDRIQIAISDYIADHIPNAPDVLANLRIERVHWGMHVRNSDGEYEFNEDHASEFVAVGGPWRVRIYCDRAHWKYSVTHDKHGNVPDGECSGLRKILPTE